MATQASSKNSRNRQQPARGTYGHLFGESTTKQGLDADWNAVDPAVLLRIVWAVDTLGGSITLGTNKKGSAYYFKVYLGAPYEPVYFDGSDEGRAEMSAWAERLVEEAAMAV